MKGRIKDLKVYKTILVDGLNLLSIEFYAKKMLHNTDGRPTGMLYGACKKLLSLRRMYPSARIVFLWEGFNSLRRAINPLYKAQRPKKDNLFGQSIQDTKPALNLLNIIQLTHIGVEADDLAGWWIREHPKEFTILISNDKDWFQFIKTFYVDIMIRGNVFTRDNLRRDLGYPPDRIGIVKLLVGDASDNISGIERFPTSLAALIACKCNKYQDIFSFNCPTPYKKWNDIIKGNKEKIEANAQVLLPHEDWVKKESMLIQKPQANNLSEMKKQSLELKKYLLGFGIKSLLT